MFGLFVPSTDLYWVFLENLLNCVELSTAIKYEEALTYYMELLPDFVTFFPDIQVKPKIHYGLHYGSETRNAGPARTRFTP